MKIISFKELIENKETGNTPVILTIGVFDGCHKGHQALIDKIDELKKEIPSSLSVLITFNTNPKTDKPKNVDTLRLREENVEKKGIDYFVIIDFSSEFSRISARGFIELLSSSVNPAAIVVGEDFRFGCPSSSASAMDLKELFLECGKDVMVFIEKSILTEGGEKISSTLVRRVIENGGVECISSLTGRNYRVDLMPVTSKFDSNALVICRSSIQQLLPPPGNYWARAVFTDSRNIPVEVLINDENLTLIRDDEGNDVYEEEHLDSIYFLEKENGIK